MSVVVVLRVPGDPKTMEAYAAGPGGAVMERVAAAGKAAGAIHHLFAAGDGEILVFDEWPDEQTFQAFFAGQPEIPDIMRDAGATGAPTFEFYRRLDTPDAF